MCELRNLRRMVPMWHQKGSRTRIISRTRVFSFFYHHEKTGARRGGIKQNHEALGCIWRVSCDMYIKQQRFSSQGTQHESSAIIDEYPDGHYDVDYFFVRTAYQFAAKM